MALDVTNTQYARIVTRFFEGAGIVPNYNGSDFTTNIHASNDVRDQEIIVNKTDRKIWYCFDSSNILEIFPSSGGGGVQLPINAVDVLQDNINLDPNLQNAINEIFSDILQNKNDIINNTNAINNHVNDQQNPHNTTALLTPFDDSFSNIGASNVQKAIEAIDAKIDLFELLNSELLKFKINTTSQTYPPQFGEVNFNGNIINNPLQITQIRISTRDINNKIVESFLNDVFLNCNFIALRSTDKQSTFNFDVSNYIFDFLNNTIVVNGAPATGVNPTFTNLEIVTLYSYTTHTPVIDSVNSASTSNALSANQGRLLAEQIVNIGTGLNNNVLIDGSRAMEADFDLNGFNIDNLGGFSNAGTGTGAGFIYSCTPTGSGFTLEAYNPTTGVRSMVQMFPNFVALRRLGSDPNNTSHIEITDNQIRTLFQKSNGNLFSEVITESGIRYGKNTANSGFTHIYPPNTPNTPNISLNYRDKGNASEQIAYMSDISGGGTSSNVRALNFYPNTDVINSNYPFGILCGLHSSNTASQKIGYYCNVSTAEIIEIFLFCGLDGGSSGASSISVRISEYSPGVQPQTGGGTDKGTYILDNTTGAINPSFNRGFFKTLSTRISLTSGKIYFAELILNSRSLTSVILEVRVSK